ncbi:MAG: 5-methyltetrahydropteroyltriglutamate--homocysteine S-methyltransferase [Candidatus Omnitrophica bacterium]|nr:5-methyltetrahydropteroyltriglutamate--homocysteine S-methyltransferase [Candidatus Omnitrophota bacterium]
MKTYAYGFPRLGSKREYKKAIEGFWKEKVSKEDAVGALTNIQKENIKTYKKNIDVFPDGEMSFYDPMLDIAILCGLYDPKNLSEYYELCRGLNALEMTKWFNTNYHYLVTDFSAIKNLSFRPNDKNIALQFKQVKFPQFIGPFTFLKLSKGIKKKDFKVFFIALVKVYKDILANYKKAQIDEPAFVMDLERDEIELIREGYDLLGDSGCKIILMTYYGSVDFMEDLLVLPVSAIGLDFARGKASYEYILKNGFPKDKTLIAGLVDGRNIWKNDFDISVARLKMLSEKAAKLLISNAAPLYHLPVSLSVEQKLDDNLKECLAFAEEKLAEIKVISECFEGKRKIPKKTELGSYGRDEAVSKRIDSLRPEDFIKKIQFEQRRKRHDSLLRLPLFPTTTIGSYPQTPEVRNERAAYLGARVSLAGYKRYIQGEIDKLIKFQEDLGLDVLVHGEFERTDMVEFFAQKLSGIATTQNSWVISYGTRVYRPPIIFGDISRPSPMTLDEIQYAQAKTNKPVKGMLTGAVTIIAWSYCREDIPLPDVAFQISLALKDEILDYEKAGIKIVQVDEAAFREKAPIKKCDWEEYFDWAVKSFNLATNTNPDTQIHTHMCYSEFGEIIDYINRMDFDVISIEASRSKGDIIRSFEGIDFKRQIGLGVWDIHSPVVPVVEQMLDIVRRSLQRIPKENFWLNPDCGLKTRDWPETIAALQNLVEAAGKIRCAGNKANEN